MQQRGAPLARWHCRSSSSRCQTAQAAAPKTPAGLTVRAAGPAGVDEPHVGAVLLNLLRKHGRVLGLWEGEGEGRRSSG